MNAKQALRFASKHIEVLEQELMDMSKVLHRAEKDIRDYNLCIDSMISGGSPCDWCDDLEECQLEAKGKGCELWMLRFWKEEYQDGTEDQERGDAERADDGTGGGSSGTGAGGIEVPESPVSDQPDTCQ